MSCFLLIELFTREVALHERLMDAARRPRGETRTVPVLWKRETRSERATEGGYPASQRRLGHVHDVGIFCARKRVTVSVTLTRLVINRSPLIGVRFALACVCVKFVVFAAALRGSFRCEYAFRVY